MDNATLPQSDDHVTSETKGPAGLAWQEFFLNIGQGTRVSGNASQEASRGSVQERALYASENGDRWSLAWDPDTGCVFVRHRPNQPSGGQVSDVEVGEFLSRGSMGPEKQELLRLIGHLAQKNGFIDEAQDQLDRGSSPQVP